MWRSENDIKMKTSKLKQINNFKLTKNLLLQKFSFFTILKYLKLIKDLKHQTCFFESLFASFFTLTLLCFFHFFASSFASALRSRKRSPSVKNRSERSRRAKPKKEAEQRKLMQKWKLHFFRFGSSHRFPSLRERSKPKPKKPSDKPSKWNQKYTKTFQIKF